MLVPYPSTKNISSNVIKIEASVPAHFAWTAAAVLFVVCHKSVAVNCTRIEACNATNK